MKKLFFTLLTLCLCGATWAYDFEYSGFYYNIVDADSGLYHVEVTHQLESGNPAANNPSSYTGEITIPEYAMDGNFIYEVVGIGEYAFANSSITSVTSMAASVTSIGTRAFNDCRSLTTIALSSGLTSIGTYAFHECSALTEIEIPGNITTIESNAFDSCTSLATVTISGNVTSIESYAFDQCTSLTSITLPDSLTSIGTYAFYGCSSLATIDLPSALTSIGAQAFRGCIALTGIVIPDNVTTIEDFTFDGCTSLANVTLSANLTSIGQEAFVGCSSLTEIIIPKGVTSYGADAFGSCSSLKSVILLSDDPSSDTFGGTAGTRYSDVFDNDSGITFYVPRGSAAKYAASDSPWESEVEIDGDSFNFFSISIDKMYTDGSDYYATYYMDEENYEVDVPSNSTLYAVTSVSDGVAKMEALTGDIIPSGTPLIIKANDSSESNSVTYYFWRDYYDEEGKPYFSESTSTISVPTENMLYGHVDAGMITEPSGNYLYYKLSLDPSGTANSIGFYYGAEGGAAYEAGAHKCWLAVPSDSANGAEGISIKKGDEGDTTGISSVESAVEGATVKGIYTIQGVRVSNMNQPGLYIVDGKKVLVK